MLDLYITSAAVLFVGCGIGVLLFKYKREQSDNTKTSTNKNQPQKLKSEPIPRKVYPVEFTLSSIDRVIRPHNERKRNVGGRITVSDLDVKRFNARGNVKYKWRHEVSCSGPGSVSVSGGGTRTSKFIDLKLTRKSIHLEAFAFGKVFCDVEIDGKIVATGVGQVKLGIIPTLPPGTMIP